MELDSFQLFYIVEINLNIIKYVIIKIRGVDKMDNEGYDFLNKIYQNLHLSDEVMHTASPSDTKNEKIAKYMERLERLHRKAFDETRASRDHDIAMLKGLYYRKYVIKRENIPETYFELQKKIALERGMGHLEYTEEAKTEEIERIIQEQKESLDKWIEYFASPDTDVYPTWYKYYAFQGMLKLGAFDKSKDSFSRRTASTVKSFIELDREALAFIYDILKQSLSKEQIEDEELEKLIDNGNFGKLYGYALKKLDEAQKDISSDDGIWKKYEQGSDPEILYRDIHGKGTGWCTAGGLETATMHVNGGDFYVYFTKDRDGEYNQPRIAIRKEGPKIAEIRGIGPNQNLESNMERVVERKLQEEDFPDRDEYKQKVEDMQMMTYIYTKWQNKVKLTKGDLRFLYEIDREIIGFGYQTDPRKEEIKKKRNLKKDLSTVFNCDEKQISTTKKEALRGGIIYHYGYLDLSDLRSAEGVHLPKNINKLNLSGLKSAEGLQLPENIQCLNLNGLKSAEGLQLPENIDVLNLNGLKSAKGLQLPEHIDTLNLWSLESAEGLHLPETIDVLNLHSLKSAEGLQLPEHIDTLDLWSLESAEGLHLPKNINNLYLSSLKSAEGLHLPENINSLDLSDLESAKGLHLPNNIHVLYLFSLESAKDLQLPEHIDNLYLDSLKSAEGLYLPENINELYLSGLESAEGLQLPENIHDLDLGGLESAEGLQLPKNIHDLDLRNLESAKELQFPEHITGELRLESLTSFEGAILPHTK